MAISPMMRQYLEIKNSHKEQILFFRLGDFYEMFFEDALTAARELELTLTGKDCGLDERAPMCGVPYHSCEGYIKKLIEKGYKVAIAEQMEEAQKGAKLVSREVVRIITPGTVIESSMLTEGENNYVAAAYLEKGRAGLAFCDVSTGELFTTEREGDDLGPALVEEFSRFSPSEIVLNHDAIEAFSVESYIRSRMPIATEILSDASFSLEKARERVLSHFKKESLSSLHLAERPAATAAVGALLAYVETTQKNAVERILSLEFYGGQNYMNMDETVLRNLELMENMSTGARKGSLLWVLDKAETAMGKRLLKNWLGKPLRSAAQVNNRLDTVEELWKNTILLGDLRAALANIYDLQRVMTRVVYGSVNPREMRSLAYTCSKIPHLRSLIAETHSAELDRIYSEMDELLDIYALIDQAIDPEPPIALKEGGVIRRGYRSDLDELRELLENTRSFLGKIETSERERTGIKSLKIGYNRVFGYYLEITNSYKDQVPPEYIRKQTLTGAERYITEELKKLEEKILGASERALQIESDLFEEVRGVLSSNLSRIQSTAGLIAELDVFCSLAWVAQVNQYCRPTVDQSDQLKIVGGRHPVVEQMLPDEPFVPNDTKLDGQEHRIMLITGPNMAGKSTYMRQTALITLLAQMGSFVPAESAHIGVVDSIFTRIGASDDLSTGRSTFMVEMSEVAHILESATAKSLIILDEIGRGTSTYDGMSIARAVLEFISSRVGAKTLFATHYHELTELEGVVSGVDNYNIAVKKRGESIIFIRRIIKGPADESYGIEVSRLAGIPLPVVERSREILRSLEGGEDTFQPRTENKGEEQSPAAGKDAWLVDAFKNTDVETLSPLEALNLLYEWKKGLSQAPQG